MATQLEDQIAMLQAQLTSLSAQKAASDAAEAAKQATLDRVPATDKIKQLAIALHTNLCTGPHMPKFMGGPMHMQACIWRDESADSDTVNADWTKEEHALWLTRARLALTILKDLGFTVTEPS